jgi:ABC-type phosphate transport system substrate-binding protein
MKASNKTRWLIVVLSLLGGCSAARAQDVTLVVNKNTQISEISAADLRAIYMGTKTRFSDGSHAVPVTLKGGPAHEVFLRNYLAERPDEFRAQWRKAVFTGQGAMPRAFDSESALIEFVAATSGALGYVSHVSANDNVKLLTITK